MFKLFLGRKLSSQESEDSRAQHLQKNKLSHSKSADDFATAAHMNRRAFPRYEISYKHLSLMSEQDILIIHDVSLKGFCAIVSQRTADRFNINDQYTGKIRYLGEVYDLNLRVAWKKAIGRSHDDHPQLGLEVADAPQPTLDFIKRLVRPIKLGQSLDLVDEQFTSQDSSHVTQETQNMPAEPNPFKRIWLHGDDNTDLYVWRSTDDQISEWEVVFDKKFTRWNPAQGYRTGRVTEIKAGTHDSPIPVGKSLTFDFDKSTDAKTVLMAKDIIMACSHDKTRNDLVQILERHQAA